MGASARESIAGKVCVSAQVGRVNKLVLCCLLSKSINLTSKKIKLPIGPLWAGESRKEEEDLGIYTRVLDKKFVVENILALFGLSLFENSLFSNIGCT